MVYEPNTVFEIMEDKFACEFCPLVFAEKIRLEKHVAKAHKKKLDLTYRDHQWYAAGAGSGYV